MLYCSLCVHTECPCSDEQLVFSSDAHKLYDLAVITFDAGC